MAEYKKLILYCLPFMEKGVGSAWGLPVTIAGKKHISVLSLSEKLLPLRENDPFRAERIRELELLGVGPLGRYLGGEPVKPLRLGPEDFFGFTKRSLPGAALLFSSTALLDGVLEFDNTRWIAKGSVPELFTAHLEFLRSWGFSGGVYIQESSAAPLLAGYLDHLQKENIHKLPMVKIIVLVSKSFFEKHLAFRLPNAKSSGDPAAGEIPVGINYTGDNVLKSSIGGLVIAFYEDLASFVVQKVRCDILLFVSLELDKSSDNKYSILRSEISATLKLSVSGAKQQKKSEKKGLSLHNYLFRDLTEVKPLPFPSNRKADHETKRQIQKTAYMFNREENTYGCMFEVHTKFSGLRAVDFKEEQKLFYYENHTKLKIYSDEVPPVRPGTPFMELNETQMKFFFRWRSECRRGIVLDLDSPYMETYIQFYARELILCMGSEGPMQHFLSLLHLFHDCMDYYPETAELLCSWLVDFLVIYGIGAEAVPLLVEKLINKGWFNKNSESEEILIDLCIYYFFINKTESFENPAFWPLIRTLIAPKVLARKENNDELGIQCCKTLGIMDSQLRRDWGQGFFGFFCPPLHIKEDRRAFNTGMGDSSYTVYRPGFSSHKPLLDILSALVLEPKINPLPGLKARIEPLSLENELLEELRKESNEVREMLKQDYTQESVRTAESIRTQKAVPRLALLPKQAEFSFLPADKKSPADKKTIEEFIGSLSEAEKKALHNMADMNISDISDMQIIDQINAAYYERFGDLLIDTGTPGALPSISAEYADILDL